MHGGSPLRSAPGADRSGHGDAEPAGSSHRLSRVFNVYICSARLPPCACSLACYSSNGIFQPQSTSRPPTVPAHTPAPACTPRCFGYRNHTLESPALPMQSPAVSRSRHLTVCDGVSACGHASVSGRHASGLCIEYSFPIDAPPVGPRLDEVSAHTPAPACTPRCFGFRNHTPESPALPMQSPAVSRSRHLTVCGGVSVCASAIVPDIRCFGYRNLTLETSSPSSQSSAVASPGPAKCCARSTSPLCHAVI